MVCELQREPDYERYWKIAARCERKAASQGPDAVETAEAGIHASSEAIKIEPNRVEGHYYRALCVGRLLAAQGIPSLTRIGEIPEGAERAIAIDPTYDDAGPHRLLGSFLSQAPFPWGDSERAEFHLREAVRLAPENADNQRELTEHLAR